MTSTAVRLYRCDDCGKQRYKSDIEKGTTCGCGSGHVKFLAYNKIRFIKALFNDKYVRDLYWNENIKRGKLSVYKKNNQ